MGFIVQLSFLIRDELTSTELYTQMERVNLAEQTLPLRMSICVTPPVNITELEASGYKSYLHYQIGQSKFNNSLFGWAGHKPDGKRLYASASTLNNKMSLWKNLSNIVKGFGVLKNNTWIFEGMSNEQDINNMVRSEKAFYSKYCFTMKSKVFLASTIYIKLKANHLVNEINIQFEDANLFTGRHISQHNLNYKGDKIGITGNQSKNVLKVYDMEMNEEIFVEEDRSKNCANYPTRDYESYNECDKQYSLNRLAAEVGPGFTPLWATDNISTVTVEPTWATEKTAFITLATGLQVSDCKLPCKIMKTVTTYSSEQAYHYSGIAVNFKNDMQITSTRHVRFDPVKFLCDIGGILGLWLGLGLVQLSNMVVDSIKQAIQNCNARNAGVQ